MTREETLEIVQELLSRRSETEGVDVKTATGGTPRRLFEPLSAFSNRTGGGIVLLGLDEREGFAPVGVGDPQKLLEDIGSLASSEMEPPLRPECTVAEIEDKTLIAVEIPEVRPEQKPCYYKPAGLQKGSYIRVGNTNRQMTDYEVFGYLSARSQPRHDEDAVLEASMEDLDREALQSHISNLKRARPEAEFLNLPLEQALAQMRLVKDVDGIRRPTLAGILVFGQNPQTFYPQLVITFVQYYGVSETEPTPRGARFLDNRKFEGSIPYVIERSVNHVMASIRKSTLIDGAFSRDIPEYPDEAIREGILNAVAHRDYSHSVRGTPIRIRLFADRLEILSPGGLFGNVTEETLEEEQSTRNVVLVRTMEDLHLVENRGSGIPVMIRAMREANLGPPLFKDTRSSFRLTLRNHTLLSPDTITWLNQFSDLPLNDRQRVGLAYVRASGSIGNSDYRRLNHVDVLTASQELRELVGMKLVVSHGVKRWTRYSLGVAAEAEPEVLPPRTPQEKVLAHVKERGSISNAECRHLLNLNTSQASYLLTKMAAAGQLRRAGKKRWTRYSLPIPGK
jgi:ATP-dependent DNA helicase RecG